MKNQKRITKNETAQPKKKPAKTHPVRPSASAWGRSTWAYMTAFDASDLRAALGQ